MSVSSTLRVLCSQADIPEYRCFWDQQFGVHELLPCACNEGIHVRMHALAHTHQHIRTHALAHTHQCVCTHAPAHMHQHVHMHAPAAHMHTSLVLSCDA